MYHAVGEWWDQYKQTSGGKDTIVGVGELVEKTSQWWANDGADATEKDDQSKSGGQTTQTE